jgi:HrpA-like RNA helicase
MPTLLVRGSLKNVLPEYANDIPAEYVVNWVKKRMDKTNLTFDDRVLILRSETGSGKSTVLPVYLFRILRDQLVDINTRYEGRSVVCTQPRVLNTRSITRDLDSSPYYPDIILNKTLGFSTGALKEGSTRGLIYMVVDTLFTQLKIWTDEEIIERYSIIIIDEAHERSLSIDLVLMEIKQFLARNLDNKDLPFIILASATIDMDKYTRYFGIGEDNKVYITGSAFGIEEKYLEENTRDYIKTVTDTIIKIHEENKDDPPNQCDILVFMPGAGEQKEITEALNEIETLPYKLLIIERTAINENLQDYRDLTKPLGDLLSTNKKGKKPIRRIIVSTSVAETGVTIDTLKYCIDNGWNRTPEYYPNLNIYGTLMTKPCSQSRITQRRGRVGRLFPGKFFPIYTRKTFDSLIENQLPDICTDDLNKLLVNIIHNQMEYKKREGIKTDFRIEDVDLLDSLPSDTASAVLEKCFVLGYIDDNIRNENDSVGYGLTQLGNMIRKTSTLTLEWFRVIMAGFIWEVPIIDLITIIAISESFSSIKKAIDKTDSVLLTNIPKLFKEGSIEDTYVIARYTMYDNFLEGLLFYNTFCDVMNESNNLADIEKWCVTNKVKYDDMMKMTERRDDIINDLLIVGINPFWVGKYELSAKTPDDLCFETIRRYKKCLYDGFRLNVLKYNNKKEEYEDRHGVVVKVFPLFDKNTREVVKKMGFKSPKSKYMITNGIILKKPSLKEDNMQYTISCGLISSMDGYIGVDEEFLGVR